MKPDLRNFLSLAAALAAALALAGCGGSTHTVVVPSSAPSMDTPSTDTPSMEAEGNGDTADAPDMEAGGNGDTAGTPEAPAPVADLGAWTKIRVGGYAVGITHDGHDLFARYDLGGVNPRLSASAPAHQPTASATWTGRWEAYYGEELESRDVGSARVRVSVAGGQTAATLTYSGINIPAVPGSITTPAAAVTDGRFAPSATITVAGEQLSFAGQGQFGGTAQQGVVGYIGGPDFRSVFYGEKQN